MSASGFLLWFNNFTLRHFPKWVADAATALHYYEAILAAASILIWHFYMVLFDPDVYPMDRAWLTGKVSAEHLRHTRPAYYLELALRQASSGGSATPPEAQGARTKDSPPELGAAQTSAEPGDKQLPPSTEDKDH